nr:hypothetical protein [Tanacetum cinerariifolium]
MEEDIEIDTIETEDGKELDIVDGDDVRDHIKVDPRDDRVEFEANAGDTVVLGIDPRLVLMVDEEIIESIRGDSSRLSGTKDGIIRIVRSETTQRQLEVDQMIASEERTAMVESIRSLRSENIKVRALLRIERDRVDSLCLHITMTNTCFGMTPATIEEMINRHVAEALEAYKVNRNLGLEYGNGNGGNRNQNRGNGNGHGGNGNEDGRGDRPVARECTYQDFMKFQELTMMCTKMVPGEEDRVERFIEGVQRTRGDWMPIEEMIVVNNHHSRDRIREVRMLLEPIRLCTVKCSNCKRVRHKTRDCRAALASTTQGTSSPNQMVNTCFECGAPGHYRKDCPKINNQNRGNKARIPEARGKEYVLGGGDANPGSNTVTGTFLLNDHHAYMLFNSGANRSFVSNTFSTLLDITPSALDVSYVVELADQKTSKPSNLGDKDSKPLDAPTTLNPSLSIFDLLLITSSDHV